MVAQLRTLTLIYMLIEFYTKNYPFIVSVPAKEIHCSPFPNSSHKISLTGPYTTCTNVHEGSQRSPDLHRHLTSPCTTCTLFAHEGSHLVLATQSYTYLSYLHVGATLQNINIPVNSHCQEYLYKPPENPYMGLVGDYSHLFANSQII